MATIEQLGVALKNADAAGDVNAARALAQALKQMRGQQQDQIDPNQANAELSALTQQAGAGQAANLDQTDNRIRANMEATKIDSMRGTGMANDASAGLLNGGTFGLADELYSTTLGAGSRMFRDGVGYSEAVQREQMLADALKRNRQERHPKTDLVTNIIGGLGSGGGAIGTGISGGIKTGAAYGGLYGFGETEGGIKDRLSGAAGGAASGALIGGAIPIVARGVKAAAKPVTDAISARLNPEKFAMQKLSERIAGNGQSAASIANKMAQNPGSSLADVGGKSAKTLLRTATNIPGPAKDRVTTQLNVRQFGQGDRIKSVISQTFANPDAYLTVKDDIAAAASKAAKPLYERAYSQPVHYSESLQGILETNAGKQALAKAEQLASNEQVPFKQVFVNVANDGLSATAKRVPDMRGWDYVKRAMDDMISAQTDTITGKVTNEGRILVGLKNKMLSELDAVNPAYAQARKVWSGGAQLDDALEVGRKALTMSPEGLRRQLAGMNPTQREAARVGAADALRAEIDRAGWTNNSAMRIIGGRQRMQNLETLFESKAKFAEARKAIFAELRKRATYDAVKGNSTTAAQLADMADAGGMQEVAQFGKNAATGGVVNATLSWVGSRLKMLGGLTPKVADEISKTLMATDPNTVRGITNELMRIDAAKLAGAERAKAVQALLTRIAVIPTATGVAQSR